MEKPASSLGPHPGWVLARVILFMAGCMFVFAAASGFAPKGKAHDFISLGGATLVTYLLTWLFVRWDGLRMSDVGAAFSTWSLPRFAAGVLLGSGMVGLHVGGMLLSGYVRWERVPATGWAAASMSFVLFLAVALREELAFRGYPLRRLHAVWGVWIAQLLVALVFAGEHFGAGYPLRDAILGVFMGALLFGAAALLTRGLAVPVGIHLAWNFGTWMIGTKDTPGLWKPVVVQAMADRAWWVAMSGYWLGGALVLLVLWRWQRISNHE